MPCLLFVDGGTAYADDWASSEPGRGNPSFKPSPLPLGAGSGPSAFLSAHGVGVVAGAGTAASGTLVYNPSTNTWSQGASMPQGAWNAAAFPIPGGAGAVVGGRYGSNIYALNRIYNPASNTWSTGASMPTARSNLAAFPLPDGRGVAVGGSTGSGYSDFVAVTEIYNPATNTWSAGASMPAPRSNLAAFPLPDGRGVAVGGSRNQAQEGIVEIYDPATNTWSAGASMPTARSLLAAFPLMDGRGAAVGGSVISINSSITRLAANEIYDPASNTWSTGASMPTARDALAAFPLPDGRGVAVGGVSDVGTHVVEIYF